VFIAYIETMANNTQFGTMESSEQKMWTERIEFRGRCVVVRLDAVVVGYKCTVSCTVDSITSGPMEMLTASKKNADAVTAVVSALNRLSNRIDEHMSTMSDAEEARERLPKIAAQVE